MVNPFEITKASDFDDSQISEYLVDRWGASTFEDVLKPKTPVPKLLLGGKGSGKTHLMRMLAWTTKHLAGRQHDLYNQTLSDGFLGIYMRCDSLNGARFAGKGISTENWHIVYCYCMELRLAELTLEAICQLLPNDPVRTQAFIDGIKQLFNAQGPVDAQSLESIVSFLRQLTVLADHKVANAYRLPHLDIDILFGLGSLIFGIPEQLVKFFPEFRNVRFLYLIDELENLSESQQWFVQALIRFRRDPCSIIVGGRLYGVRTYQIGPEGEQNVQDSEFEKIVLDDIFRQNPTDYSSFVENIVKKRLELHGYPTTDISDKFETEDSNNLFESEARRLVHKWDSTGRPRRWISDFRKFLEDQRVFPTTPQARDQIVEHVTCTENPVLEKVNLLSFYQEMSGIQNLENAKLAAQNIQIGCASYTRGDRSSWYATKVGHYYLDMYAQLRREASAPQSYLGYRNFVVMSEGLPRNVLTILKNVFEWSKFGGEHPFREGLISAQAQQKGVEQASEWFFTDVRDPGPDGVKCRRIVDRIAELLRIHRFALKPVEKTTSSFSVPVNSLVLEANRMLNVAVNWSLLVDAGSHNYRNGLRVDKKFQISGMIAPKWDLPIVKGGTLELDVEEANTIFSDLDNDNGFNLVRANWERRFSPRKTIPENEGQLPLITFEDEEE